MNIKNLSFLHKAKNNKNVPISLAVENSLRHSSNNITWMALAYCINEKENSKTKQGKLII